ncbi:phospholipid phosphatase homolog 1.2 homolog isoform X2 [Phlebotomus argentipes]|uniref:phospholipid phosphatase homolog 1.2 homolog isoform X2 n=1 Tax=Phlebotomus argentipes TaxID=94469 RepID=UPI002892CA80|nr:phospholipid phosphatase homolog 1.2 homolog isoform X2 [Phlebotomus argentipes]
MSAEKPMDKCIIGGTSKIIYTTNGDDKLEGHFNFGHTIPELTTSDTCKLPLPQVTPDSGRTSRDSSTDFPTVKAFIKKMGTLAIFTDISLCLLFLLWVILVELAIIPSNKRGFICGDISIGFKFRGDTISTGMVLGSIIIPLFLIWLIEALKMRGHSNRLPLWKRSLYVSLYWYNKFLIGFSIHLAIIEAIKTLMGESRPHFLDSCRPDTAVNCTIGTFISDFTCTNTELSSQLVNDSFRSFPSGHASVGFYEALFMAWFLYKRFHSVRSKWVVPLLQTLCFVWGSACAITRITDNRHHWWDVLCGTCIGLVFAAYAMHSDTELLQVEYQNERSANSTPLFAGYRTQNYPERRVK